MSDSEQPRIEIVAGPEGLPGLRERWDRLAEQARNVFLTPGWFDAALRHYGSDCDPRVIVVLVGERVVGVAPLLRSGSEAMPVLRFAGSNLGDEFHPLVESGNEAEVSAALGAALDDEPGIPPLLICDHAPSAAGWPAGIRAGSRRRLGLRGAPDETLPFISFEGMDWEGYLAGLSKGRRKRTGYDLRVLEREFDSVGFRLAREPDRLGGDLDTFFDLHDRRWSGEGGSAAITATSRAFLTEVAETALDADRLRLWFLELDDRPVAAWFGFSIGGRYVFYQSGYDPEWSDYSVGVVLIAHTIRAAIEEGASEYDMLRGSESYKFSYSNSERSVSTVSIGPRWHPAYALTSLEAAIRSLGRRMPEDLRDRGRAVYARIQRRLPTGRSR